MKWRRRDRRTTRQGSHWPGSGFAESTLAELAWERTRKAVARWGWAGLVLGGLVAVVAFAPATWLAQGVASATKQRLLLADARGTVWSGNATAVLSGGAESRSAALLPGRVSWRIGLRGLALELRLRQSCCITDELVLLIRPGFGSLALQLPAGQNPRGEWPAAWLAGVGAPWNTLQPEGTLRLSSPGLSLDMAAGRWQLSGQAELEMADVGSRLTPLDRLGSYVLRVDANGAQGPSLNLRTLDGALQLNGQGQWTGSQLRFRGEARAAPGFENVLDNLLNIIGRRQGALATISIG
jgi:general secretion pathway protein N